MTRHNFANLIERAEQLVAAIDKWRGMDAVCNRIDIIDECLLKMDARKDVLVQLEKMLTEIAAYYHVEVSFLNDDARQLRFHFVWKREDGLRHTIEKLNRFESLSVRLGENKIIVE